MKLSLKLLMLIILSSTLISAQGRDYRKNLSKDNTSSEQILDVTDRAVNVITINKLGQTVTNTGQFYPYSGVLPTGRWPITTDHDQIYKMNFYVGIPGNVIATRANNSKDWDAMPGFHNPDSGLIAISTNPESWPIDNQGNPYWPLKTADGRDSIVSQEDTYAVYNDASNSRTPLNIEVRQSSYAWATSKDEDYIVFKKEVINRSLNNYQDVYLALYSDFDAGGVVNDYEDDKWGLEVDRNFYYIYDNDNVSNDWPGSKPFYLGIVFLETPKVNGEMLGLTDWHYSSDGDSPWGDVENEEQVLYEWMSSNERLKNDATWPNLFHGNNLKYDDVTLINRRGERLDCISSTGPYNLNAGEKLTLIYALVAGADYEEISENVDRVKLIYENGLQIIPPPKPNINGFAFNNKIQLKWSNEKEFGYLDQNGNTFVKEYRIYKTLDPYRTEWGEPYAVVPVDTNQRGVVEDAYVFEDTSGIRNYFYYSYSVTSIDYDGLESSRAFLPAEQTVSENTAELRPLDQPQSTLDNIKVVPNPYIISATWERKRLGDPLLGEPVRDLAFTNLPDRCTIKIFTIDGNLVKTIYHSRLSGTTFWDLRTEYNQLIATGVYFYHIESELGEKIGKFAVVR